LTFSYPNAEAKPRLPTPSDPAGGIFTSPRNTNDPDANTLYGVGNAGRVHGATDYLLAPNMPVYATMTGIVDRIGDTGTGFKLVQIKAFDGTVARELYVDPIVQKGDKVTAGETMVGHSVQLSTYPGYANVPNHVHCDYIDRNGRKFDPFL